MTDDVAMALRDPTFHELVADELRRDLPAREAEIAKVIPFIGGAAVLVLCAFGPIIGSRGAFGLAAVTAIVPAYYAMLFVLHKGGGIPPALTWLSTLVDVATPAAAVAVACHFISPVYAFTDATMPIFAGMVSLSALRTPRHPLFAGVMAGALYFVVFLVFRPDLQAPELLGLTPPNIALRSVFLVVCGGLAAITANQLRDKVEGAVRAARQRDVFGKYTLHERIGAGGMAEVFRATYALEGGFERQVAVKRILPGRVDDEHYAQLFRREANISAMLVHPNIVQVHDMGHSEGQMYLAMELIEGATLRRVLQYHRRLPAPLATYVIAQVALALDYVHHRRDVRGEVMNLVHRDVNPANILLSAAGEVKLTDFGIALGAAGTRLTHDGSVRGKQGFIAPEQFTHDALDARADLYALGVSLYECLAGLDPFGFRDDAKRATKDALKGDIPSLLTLCDCSSELNALARRLLAVDPHERPQSGRELYDALMALPASDAPRGDAATALAAVVTRYAQPRGPGAQANEVTDVQGLAPDEGAERSGVFTQSRPSPEVPPVASGNVFTTTRPPTAQDGTSDADAPTEVVRGPSRRR